ncbi:unnamed protein product [Oikopleura dioica]|uniref:RRM domain-containing protein n=1 Tax=Oikopleura dioica TaxID=34765 RepID=E4YS69_OIKDI|nr:unnamed protein product [Oikopleura dioica]
MSGFVFPPGLNLLEKKTKEIVSGGQAAAKKNPFCPEVSNKRRVIQKSDDKLLVPDAKRRERYNKEREERVKYFTNGKARNYELQGDNIKGRLLNYQAHQHEELRNQLVKEIVLTEKKKRKETERLKTEKAKSSSKPTAVMIRGLREKTFRKDFIRSHMEKYGEIVKISSVQGHARAVMVRFADYKSAVKVHKDVNNPEKKIFPKFPNAEIKLVKSESKRKLPSVPAFASVPNTPIMSPAPSPASFTSFQ